MFRPRVNVETDAIDVSTAGLLYDIIDPLLNGVDRIEFLQVEDYPVLRDIQVNLKDSFGVLFDTVRIEYIDRVKSLDIYALGNGNYSILPLGPGKVYLDSLPGLSFNYGDIIMMEAVMAMSSVIESIVFHKNVITLKTPIMPIYYLYLYEEVRKPKYVSSTDDIRNTHRSDTMAVSGITNFILTESVIGRGSNIVIKEACLQKDCNYVWSQRRFDNVDEFWNHITLLKLMSDNDISPILYEYTWDGKYATLVSEKMKETVKEYIRRYIVTCDLFEWKYVNFRSNDTYVSIKFNVALNFPSLYQESQRIVKKMHSLGYIHNDIHTQNIMFNSKNNLRLIDFEYTEKSDDTHNDTRLLESTYILSSHELIPITLVNNIPFHKSIYSIESPVSTSYRVYMYRLDSSLITLALVNYLRTFFTEENSSSGITLERNHICVWIEDPNATPSHKVVFVGTSGVSRMLPRSSKESTVMYNTDVNIDHLKSIYQSVLNSKISSGTPI